MSNSVKDIFAESASENSFHTLLSKLDSLTKGRFKDITKEEAPLSEELFSELIKEYPRYVKAEFELDNGKKANQITSDQLIAVLTSGSVFSVSGKHDSETSSMANLDSKNIKFGDTAYIVKITSAVVDGATEEDSGIDSSCNIIIYKGKSE